MNDQVIDLKIKDAYYRLPGYAGVWEIGQLETPSSAYQAGADSADLHFYLRGQDASGELHTLNDADRYRIPGPPGVWVTKRLRVGNRPGYVIQEFARPDDQPARWITPSADAYAQQHNWGSSALDWAERGWTLIANADEGNWQDTAPEDWRAAAIAFRDDYHAMLAERKAESREVCWCGEVDTAEHRRATPVLVSIWVDDLAPWLRDQTDTAAFGVEVRHVPGGMTIVRQLREAVASGIALAATKPIAPAEVPRSDGAMQVLATSLSAWLFAQPVDDEINAVNAALIGSNGKGIAPTIDIPWPLEPEQALRIAAWLAICADPTLDRFAAVLRKALSS